jgi:hypothetical protein
VNSSDQGVLRRQAERTLKEVSGFNTGMLGTALLLIHMPLCAVN